MYYWNEVIEELLNKREVLIFGNSVVGQAAAACVRGEPYRCSVRAFMVSSVDEERHFLMGIPVIDVKEGADKYQNVTILVAVTEKNLEEILAILMQYPFEHIIPLTFESKVWSEVRGNYFIAQWARAGKDYQGIEEEFEKMDSRHGNRGCDRSRTDQIPGSVRVYGVKSHRDKKLKTKQKACTYEIPIQVGAAQTEERLAKLCDNTGINISQKNDRYCELTALFWLWKNREPSMYIGLCHYRRHFAMDEKECSRLADSDIDMVLTIPILNFPNVREVYASDHAAEDWNVMMEAIAKIHPDYYPAARAVSEGEYYYGYNMFIAKDAVFQMYCEWLFPILEYCERECRVKPDSYQNRYIGFLAERLLTIFVVQNEEHMKIVHVRKEFWE